MDENFLRLLKKLIASIEDEKLIVEKKMYSIAKTMLGVKELLNSQRMAEKDTLIVEEFLTFLNNIYKDLEQTYINLQDLAVFLDDSRNLLLCLPSRSQYDYAEKIEKYIYKLEHQLHQIQFLLYVINERISYHIDDEEEHFSRIPHGNSPDFTISSSLDIWKKNKLPELGEYLQYQNELCRQAIKGYKEELVLNQGHAFRSYTDSENHMIGALYSRNEYQEQSAINVDDVQFRLAAPGHIKKNRYAIIKMMLYGDIDLWRADKETNALGEEVRASSSSIFSIQRKQKLCIVLQSDDIEIEDGIVEFIWDGRYAACDFEIYIPEGYLKSQVRLKGRVYAGETVLTDLRIILDVDTEENQKIDVEKCSLSSAFVSYASKDREEVARCLQGMRAVRPDLDLFFDVHSIKMGEYWEKVIYREIKNRALFYLFWSRNAAVSKWVHKELTFALKYKKKEYIEPVPLESPDLCPPPEELKSRHFNDWTLRWTKRQRY